MTVWTCVLCTQYEPVFYAHGMRLCFMHTACACVLCIQHAPMFYAYSMSLCFMHTVWACVIWHYACSMSLCCMHTVWACVIRIQYEPNQTIHTVHLVCAPTTEAGQQTSATAAPALTVRSCYYSCVVQLKLRTKNPFHKEFPKLKLNFFLNWRSKMWNTLAGYHDIVHLICSSQRGVYEFEITDELLIFFS